MERFRRVEQELVDKIAVRTEVAVIHSLAAVEAMELPASELELEHSNQLLAAAREFLRIEQFASCYGREYGLLHLF